MGKEKVSYQEEKRNIIELRDKNPKKAMAACTVFRKKAKEDGNEQQAAVADYYYAECVFFAGRYQDCINHFSKCISDLEKYDQIVFLESAHNLMGISYTILGDIQKALSEFLLAIKWCRNAKNKLIMQSNIGVLYFDLQEYEKALKYFQKVYEKASKYYDFETGTISPNKPGVQLIITLLNMSDALCSLGRYEEASVYLDKIAEYIKVFDGKTEGVEANLLIYKCCQAKNAFGSQNLKDALAYTDEILELLKTENLDMDSVLDAEKLIPLLSKYGFMKQAKILLEKAYENVIKIDTTSHWVHYYACCIDFYKAEQNISKLIESYDNYFKYGKQKESENNKKFLRDIETKLSLEKALIKQRQSEEKAKKLKLLSETDALTGVLNRFSMNKMLEDLFHKAQNEQMKFGIMLFDVDCFKEFNDTYGHVAGDKCLKAVSKEMYQFHGDNIFVARYGGDEFLLMAIGQTNDRMKEIAHEIQNRIKALAIEHKNSKNEEKIVSITIGVTNHIPPKENSCLDEVQMADEALYDAKRTKRGTISFQFME